MVFLLIPAFVGAQLPKETGWKPPLAEGRVPECPDHVGSRTLRRETVSYGAVKAYIVGECFTVHGRLSAWNGSPTMRMWRVGTKRILGNYFDWPLPEDLAEHMNWDVEAWGDFEVCPFTKERPGVMQMVCIESASHAFYKSR